MADKIEEHEVEVVLRINTSFQDRYEALKRSGIVEGQLIGEALVESVVVYSPEPDES